MMRLIWWPIIIVASAIGAGLAVVSDLGSPIRPLISFWFLLTCPGMAFVRLLRVEGRLTELTLAIGLSIAIDTIVAEAMLYAGAWSPNWILVVLICISIGGAVLQIISARKKLLLAYPQEETRDGHEKTSYFSSVDPEPANPVLDVDPGRDVG
jgi:uncharacterized membrane protein